MDVLQAATVAQQSESMIENTMGSIEEATSFGAGSDSESAAEPTTFLGQFDACARDFCGKISDMITCKSLPSSNQQDHSNDLIQITCSCGQKGLEGRPGQTIHCTHCGREHILPSDQTMLDLFGEDGINDSNQQTQYQQQTSDVTIQELDQIKNKNKAQYQQRTIRNSGAEALPPGANLEDFEEYEGSGLNDVNDKRDNRVTFKSEASYQSAPGGPYSDIDSNDANRQPFNKRSSRNSSQQGNSTGGRNSNSKNQTTGSRITRGINNGMNNIKRYTNSRMGLGDTNATNDNDDDQSICSTISQCCNPNSNPGPGPARRSLRRQNSSRNNPSIVMLASRSSAAMAEPAPGVERSSNANSKKVGNKNLKSNKLNGNAAASSTNPSSSSSNSMLSSFPTSFNAITDHVEFAYDYISSGFGARTSESGAGGGGTRNSGSNVFMSEAPELDI